jgi:hypothetical protein
MTTITDYTLLLLKLVQADAEAQVIDELNDAGLWYSTENWRPFGGDENNWATIGNQQSDARGAVVEKIINSVDHLLLRECRRRGIDPAGPNAPRSMEEAAQIFFGVPSGNLGLLANSDRTRLAEQSVCLVVSGDKPPGNPTLTIVDQGEGQEPGEFEDTFLALSRSSTSKKNIPFVQGKFHMGSTGVLPYCSPQHNLQLILSRRDPELRPRDASWGFTGGTPPPPQWLSGTICLRVPRPRWQGSNVKTTAAARLAQRGS